VRLACFKPTPVLSIWVTKLSLYRGHVLNQSGILKAVAVIATPETRNETVAAVAVAEARPSLLADYATLFKLRVSTMVIITSAAGFYLGSLRSGISPFNVGMVKALAGIAVVTCGASALNQALERKTDRLMHRTENRPMAAGRIGLAHGLIVGFLGVFLGSLYLARATNPLTGTLTLLTAVAYVAIYTPLKQVSTINTFIGAFPGALPPLIGWTAARGMIEWPGVALFAILFVWHFPHFMAIGWMYREDSARAGVLAVHPADGHEVRKMPHKQDGEQRDAGPLDHAARGGPADQRRQRSWKCADEGVDGADLFQRRVDGHVSNGGQQRQRARKRVGGARQVQRPKKHPEESDDKPVRESNAACRHGPVLRPVHQAVGLALQRLIQRAGSARDHRNACERL